MDILVAKRKRPFSHPWNRGFRNNGWLRLAAGETEKTPEPAPLLKKQRPTFNKKPNTKHNDSSL